MAPAGELTEGREPEDAMVSSWGREHIPLPSPFPLPPAVGLASCGDSILL